MNDVLILLFLLNFLVIIVAVALKSRLPGKKWKIMMAILAVTIMSSAIIYRLLHGGF